MKYIEAIISSLRVAMTDARQNESHFESWMILNEAICDAIDALAEQPAQQEPVYHLRQYGDVTKEQLDRYMATGDINPQPAQRKPLSVEEMFEAISALCSSDKAARLAVNRSKDEYRAIEAKLKEKNT